MGYRTLGTFENWGSSLGHGEYECPLASLLMYDNKGDMRYRRCTLHIGLTGWISIDTSSRWGDALIRRTHTRDLGYICNHSPFHLSSLFRDFTGTLMTVPALGCYSSYRRTGSLSGWNGINGTESNTWFQLYVWSVWYCFIYLIPAIIMSPSSHQPPLPYTPKVKTNYKGAENIAHLQFLPFHNDFC